MPPAGAHVAGSTGAQLSGGDERQHATACLQTSPCSAQQCIMHACMQDGLCYYAGVLLPMPATSPSPPTALLNPPHPPLHARTPRTTRNNNTAPRRTPCTPRAPSPATQVTSRSTRPPRPSACACCAPTSWPRSTRARTYAPRSAASLLAGCVRWPLSRRRARARACVRRQGWRAVVTVVVMCGQGAARPRSGWGASWVRGHVRPCACVGWWLVAQPPQHSRFRRSLRLLVHTYGGPRVVAPVGAGGDATKCMCPMWLRYASHLECVSVCVRCQDGCKRGPYRYRPARTVCRARPAFFPGSGCRQRCACCLYVCVARVAQCVRAAAQGTLRAGRQRRSGWR